MPIRDSWKGYLLGGNTGLGYDVWALTPEYEELLNDTAQLADPVGKDVLDLGAGTGNLSVKLWHKKPRSLTSLDLVPEALERLKSKLPEPSKVTYVATSADGGPHVAMRRWLTGDLHHFSAVADSLPDGLRQRAYDIAQRDISVEEALTQADGEWHEVIHADGGLPFADSSFDLVTSSLVLSYMERVSDTLYEIRRILRPGGTFVASTLIKDADSSKVFTSAIKHYETAPDSAIPHGLTRETVVQALREFYDRGAGLLRPEEEGVFRFWTGEEFARLMYTAGFEHVSVHKSFGQPPQAVIVCGHR